MKWVPALLGLALSLGAGACRSSDGTTVSTVERRWAQPLGTLSRELPPDDGDQAHQALEQDAWRREHRFLDAVEPGHRFRSTRVRQVEIDVGLWSIDELYQLGGQLFTLQLSSAVGLGGADGPALRRIHQGRRGGPDSFRCTACHWRGGLAGAGGGADNAMFRGDGVHQSSAIARNPPALIGAGLKERLAQEMSARLQVLRNDAIAFAATEGYSVRIPLQTKGIDFGFITVDPEGGIDSSEIVGIDPDLVLKPFGWKGTFASIRDSSEDALLVHHGMQSEHLVIEGQAERVGPYGGDDPDGDGVIEEITEGQVTALSLFIGLLEVPQEEIPQTDPYLASMWAQGRLDFDVLGCAACHTPALTLDDAQLRIPHRYGGPTLVADLVTEGAQPRIAADAEDGTLSVRLYSDLRRHSMGPELSEGRSERGVAPDEFITPPLWGVARTRPYLHDGRAPTLEDAILLHGGEALASRDAYARLDETGRAPLRVFLTSLVRARRLVTP